MPQIGGTDTAKRNLIQRITSLFRRTIPEELPPITSERPSFKWETSKLFQLGDDRLKKYGDYDEMDDEIVEISSALDIHADFVISSEGGQVSEVYSVSFEKEGLKKESEIVEKTETDLELKQRVWFMVRNFIKYGDAFYEIVASKDRLIKLQYLDPYTIFINYGDDGKIDRDIPFIQREEETWRTVAEFAPWEVVHFKIGEEDYGVNFALLRRLRRTYRVQRMLEDTLVVTRVARANQRGVYKIDVSGMGEKEATKYIRKLKLMNKRRIYFDDNGKLKVEEDPLKPQEDIYIPVRKGGIGGDYTVVGGERHLGEIRDIEHFHNKLFAATKVPKAFLGYERDVNAKATLVQQNSTFARIVRRHRYVLAQGLKKIYRLAFLLGGVDPTRFVWKIKFPPLGSPDEEAKWNIEKIKAEVVKLYGGIGINLPTEWIIRKLMMGLTTTEADELLSLMKGEGEAPPSTKKAPEPPPERPQKQPQMHPEPEPGKGNGKPRELYESELDDLLSSINASERLRRLIRESEKAIKVALKGSGGEYY